MKCQVFAAAVTRQSVSNQDVHKLGLRQPTGLPELWIHADRSKAWQCVDFVDEDFFASKKKVDPRHASAAKDLKCLNSKFLDAPLLLGRNIRRNDEFCSLGIGIFRFIRVETMPVCWHDFAKWRGADGPLLVFEDRGTQSRARDRCTAPPKSFGQTGKPERRTL